MSITTKTLTDWFQTHSGVHFYPLGARVEDINLGDIAHALAHVCRFGGHTREFYSVAQHCVLVSELVPTEHAREGLMHDAAEAYLGDMVRPLKLHMPAYRDAEEKLERLIAQRFGLTFPWHPAIKAADNVALITEKRDLLAVAQPWSMKIEPHPSRIIPWAPDLARDLFQRRARELGLGA